MVLTEFQKASIQRFKGLYDRGGYDGTPPDHATDISNIAFSDSGEILTRPGAKESLSLFHPVKRMFLATPFAGYRLLTWDGANTIYSFDPATNIDIALYTYAGMTDFCALNMYGKTYIMPSGPLGNTIKVQIYDGTNIRAALGYPTNVTSMSAAAGTPGNIDPGVHKIAVAFITKSGFTTRPGPETTIGDPSSFTPTIFSAPGSTKVTLSGIPVGGTNVMARQIIVTKADQEEFFYVDAGYIADNTTTTLILDWFDTDLAVSADSLFDLRDHLPGGTLDSFGLFKFHGRMMTWGSTETGPVNDAVFVSKPGEPEAFDTVTGYIQLPSESDGNIVRGVASLRDVLYFTKGVGIYSTSDNLDTPSTWPVVQVDGGVGCWFYGMSTITASQTSLSINDVLIMASRGGLYLFNGVVQQPPLTYKINDIWLRFNHSAQSKITVAVDPFDQIIYCLLPVDGSSVPNMLIVGDFAEGLSAENIKWSKYNFSFPPRSIAMINFQDSSDFEYHLRIGSDDNKLYKLDKLSLDDLGTGTLDSFYQTFLEGFEFGQLSIFRALVIRGQGATLNVSLGAQDLQRIQVMNSFVAGLTPGKEYTRQINYTSEKMLVKLSSSNPFRLGRLDTYGKVQHNSRPL